MTPPPKFTPKNNLFGLETQTLTRKKEETKDKVLEEIDEKKKNELPDPPKLELYDGLANVLGPEAEDILEDNFINSKKPEDDVLENIKEEYGF